MDLTYGRFRPARFRSWSVIAMRVKLCSRPRSFKVVFVAGKEARLPEGSIGRRALAPERAFNLLHFHSAWGGHQRDASLAIATPAVDWARVPRRCPVVEDP